MLTVVRESACLDVEDRARWTPNCAPTPPRWRARAMRASPPTPKPSPTASTRTPWSTAPPAPKPNARVTVRPAPDCMTYLTALLPMTQGVAVYAALKRAADTCFDGRSRGQVMADTLVERVTGRPAEVPTPIAVNLVISDDTLLGAGTEPARLPATGPYPRRWPASSPEPPSTTANPKPPCAGSTNTRPPERSWPWNPGHGVSRAGWPRSSPPATTRAPPLTAMPPSATSTTPPRGPRRTHHHRQRPRHLRRLQLRQGSRRLARHHGHPRKRRPHNRTHHPHRQPVPIHRTPTTRAHHHQPRRDEHRHLHRPARRVTGSRPAGRNSSCPGSSPNTRPDTADPWSARCSRRRPCVDRPRAH